MVRVRHRLALHPHPDRTGLAQVKRVAPRPRLGGLRPVVDSDTLQAVIVNRYDLLSQYARSLKQVYREELAACRMASASRG
jgi:stearoyl-CoA desaturase (delta-9 desaturase)